MKIFYQRITANAVTCTRSNIQGNTLTTTNQRVRQRGIRHFAQIYRNRHKKYVVYVQIFNLFTLRSQNLGTDMVTGSQGFCRKFKISVLVTLVKIQPEIGFLSAIFGIFYNSVPWDVLSRSQISKQLFMFIKCWT